MWKNANVRVRKYNLKKLNGRVKYEIQFGENKFKDEDSVSKVTEQEKNLEIFHLFIKYLLSICSTIVVSLWGGDGIQEAMWWVREAEADEARNHYIACMRRLWSNERVENLVWWHTSVIPEVRR